MEVQIVHFTEKAADPLMLGRGARFVPLADGTGASHVTCLHLAPGARIPKWPLPQDCTVLAVHGEATATTPRGTPVPLAGGVGVLLKAGKPWALESRKGAILILVECDELEAHPSGLSSAVRVHGSLWPDNRPVAEPRPPGWDSHQPDRRRASSRAALSARIRGFVAALIRKAAHSGGRSRSRSLAAVTGTPATPPGASARQPAAPGEHRAT